MAVSDANMLAPEEVFDGKGDVKEEAELTQEERRRRRANKKRRFKGMISYAMEVSAWCLADEHTNYGVQYFHTCLHAKLHTMSFQTRHVSLFTFYY